jgi:hypothetical protein
LTDVIESREVEKEEEEPREPRPPSVSGASNGSDNGSRIRTPKAKKTASKDWTESFEVDFWPAYKRPVGKGAALFSWLRIGAAVTSQPEETELFNRIMDGLERWNETHKNDEPEFIPHPTTWLNQRRWEDETP